MYQQNQVQNQPTAAYWLSMIGGILGVLGALILIGFGALLGAVTFGFGFAVIGGLGIWILICSIVVIVASQRLKANPLEHSKWGAIILLFSIIGGWSILDFIGGILALVYKPILAGAPQQQYGPPPQQPYYGSPQQQATYALTRVCPQCGKVVQDNVKFCPNCGKQLN
jgi:ribosomal protein S27AE